MTRDEAVALGRMLRAARERVGLLRIDAAKALGAGCCGEDVDAIERGMLAPSLKQLYALAALYGATVDVCVWPRATTPTLTARK